VIDVLSRFCIEKDVEYTVNKSISEISPIGIGASAMIYALPSTKEKLITLLDFLNDNAVKYILVGGMSNILPQDTYYDGVVVSTKNMRRISFHDTVVTADSGVYLPYLINTAKKAGLGGAEALSGIPGTVGGALYSNAGAFGKCISDFFIYGEFYDVVHRRMVTLDRDQMHFHYRSSVLKRGKLISLNATLNFLRLPEAHINAEIASARAQRRETQPTNERSLGSVFKRCGEIGAGYYIDRCGLKGVSCGGAEISKKHAGFIINKGNATAKDFLLLIDLVKHKVCAKFGIELELEIEIMQRLL